MTITDLLIIYLAFGAPIAVYKYLQNRAVGIRRRIALSMFTFFFWVPTIVKLGYLYLANAYFSDDFVSHRVSDATDRRIRDLRERITADLVRLERGSSLHDTRETVNRYTGLANAVREATSNKEGRNELFEAAGRQNYALSHFVMIRRNMRRLRRHHVQARRDFLNLLDQVSRRFASIDLIATGLDLAWGLEDREAVEQLNALKVKRGEVWTSAQHQEPRAMTSAPSIAVTGTLKND
ncbi:MAG: hypothetical protein ABIO91_00080 [Pyrinomonadaceae bacterium]